MPEAIALIEGTARNGVGDGGRNGERNGAKNENDFGGQGERGEDLVGKNFGGHSRVARQKTSPMPTKIEERRGWIEFPKKGTNNPRRYAYRRRWIRANGQWTKSKPARIKSWPPMSEDDYVKYKADQERIKRANRRERRRGNQDAA